MWRSLYLRMKSQQNLPLTEIDISWYRQKKNLKNGILLLYPFTEFSLINEKILMKLVNI